MKHKNIQVLFLIILVFLLSISMTAVNAEGEQVFPSYTITDVIPGASVTLITRDFPANSDFVVSMKDMNSTGDFVDVVKFNTQAGGSFSVKIEIPEDLKSTREIAMLVSNTDGIQIPSSFHNHTPDQESNPVISGGIYTGTPSFTITEVIPGESVTISAINFPANVVFNVTMGSYNPCGFGQLVESFNSEAGGSFERTIAIPVNLKSVTPISIRLDSVEGFYAFNWFGNVAPAAVEGAEGSPAVVEPAAQCNFSVFPSFTIQSVVKGESVTIDTLNFPANSSFTVKMGYYVKGSHPFFGYHDCGPDCGFGPTSFNFQSYNGYFTGSGPMGGFNPFHSDHMNPPFNGHRSNLAFVGIEVGTYDTGDGAPQTLTYQIPTDLKAYDPIIVWIEDKGACGFYAFNYFWNRTTGTAPAANIPVVEVEQIAK